MSYALGILTGFAIIYAWWLIGEYCRPSLEAMKRKRRAKS